MHARVLSVICVLLATATVAQSRRWYATEVGRWITQKKVPASWEDAQRRCERAGAVLASPLNTELHNYLQSRLNVQNNSVAYFIGTRANHSDDGQEVHYVSVEAPVSKQAPPTTTSTPPPTSTIPSGYTYYPATGSYYKYHNESLMTWDDANTTCASEGAHLVVLNDAKEADIVAHVMRGMTWTGLQDHRTGGAMDWRTVHGEPLSDVYNAWGDGQPHNYAKYTCAYFYTYYKRLYDWPCDDTSYITYFTCEISQQ